MGGMAVGAESGVEFIGEEGLGEGLDAAAVVAGEGAEVALEGDAAVHEGADVALVEDAQVALRVGQQRGEACGEDAIEHVLPAGRQQVLWQFNQQEPWRLTIDD